MQSALADARSSLQSDSGVSSVSSASSFAAGTAAGAAATGAAGLLASTNFKNSL